MDKKNKKRAYVPPDAEINLENKKKKPPKTRYERTRAIFERDSVKKFVKGRYGDDQLQSKD